MELDGASRQPTHSKDAHYMRRAIESQTLNDDAQKRGLLAEPPSVITGPI
tara:strand:- start:214 stop:363 length:150 start_codon:yes stop_codon:yes gene_type:complete